VRRALAACKDLVEENKAAAVWRDALDAPAWEQPPVWLHGDLLPSNLLTTDGRLSAVIDFGMLGVGDPACDLLPVWAIFEGEAREDFRAALGLDDTTWQRGRGWALSWALIALAYYRDTNPAIVEMAMTTIRALLADPSR
jgi:aminoglycoside phosphotransferase (APT) family kinase protein